MALHRYLNNEKKRSQNHHLQQAYVQFMQEYRSLGHMQLVAESEILDDLLTGSNSLTELQEIKTQIIFMLGTAKMTLRKWCSNSPEILNDIPPQDRESLLQIDDSDYVKTLERKQITKRTVISNIARIFDLLGLTAPVTTLGKLFLQQLWQLKRNWDESLPQILHTKWQRFKGQLLQLNQLKIKHHLFKGPSSINVQLHGFADASERAYGAAIYTRCVDQDGEIIIQLLCSKSRVSPLRKTILPRLELCAAYLLADLAHRVLSIINFNVSNVFYWINSIIILHWLKSKLSTDDQSWTLNQPSLECSLPELRHNKSVLVAINEDSKTNYGNDLVDSIKYKNNLRSLRNIMAWINRFISNCRLRCRLRGRLKERTNGSLSTEEIENGLQSIVKIVQARAFHDEIRMLSSKGLPTTNRLNSLSPFLDDKGILRVGGHLQKSSLPFFSKHPILLPSNHPFTITLISEYHSRLMHAGPQAMLAAIREKFWPLKGRRLASNMYINPALGVLKCLRVR